MGRVGNEGRFRWSRLVFASSLAVLILGTFASFGGLSYAAADGISALRTVAKVTTAHKVVVAHSSASGQYPKAAKPAKHVTKHAAKPTRGTLGVTAKSGTLASTGLPLGLTALLSLALMGGGFLLRRAERRGRS